MAKMIRSKADESIILSAIGSTEDYSIGLPQITQTQL